MKKVLSIFLVLDLLLFTASCGIFGGNTNPVKASSIVTVKSDAEVSFVVNENNEVIEAYPLNELGEIVLTGDDYKELSLKDATVKYLQTLKDCNLSDNVTIEILLVDEDNKVQEIIEQAKGSAEVVISSAKATVSSLLEKLNNSGVITTEELKSLSVDDLMQKVKEVYANATFYGSEKLNEIYKTFEEMHLDKKANEVYQSIIEDSNGDIKTDVVNGFNTLVDNIKKSYENEEGIFNKVNEFINSAKASLDKNLSEYREKQKSLDELEAKLQNEIKENTEKFGSEAAEVMSAATKGLIEAAKTAVEAISKLYVSAKETYNKLMDKYKEEHDGKVMSLASLVQDAKDQVNKFFDEHPEVKEFIDTNTEKIKESVNNIIIQVKEKFNKEYKALIDDYHESLQTKKEELLNSK